MKKKLLSMILSTIIIINLFSYETIVNAKSTNEIIVISSDKNSDGGIKEISKCGDVEYYFEDTENLIISYNVSNNQVNYYVNDGTDLYSGKLNVKKSKNTEFESIKSVILSSYATSKSVPLSVYYESVNKSTQMIGISAVAPGSNTYNNVVSIVRNKYGYPAPYFNFYDYRLLSDNRRLDMYSTGGYSVSDGTFIPFAINTSISFITAVLGITALTAKVLFSFFVGAGSILYSAATYSVTTYNCSYIMTKDVMLGQQLKYQSVSMIVQKVILKDASFVASDVSGTWSTDPDFYYIQQIFDNAILRLRK